MASREERGTANKNGELFAESGRILDKTRYICAISPQFIALCVTLQGTVRGFGALPAEVFPSGRCRDAQPSGTAPKKRGDER